MAHALGINRDVVLWLNSKLEEPWSAERVSSFLNSEILQTLKAKFQLLDPIVKIRLFFSFLCLRKKDLQLLKKEIDELIEIGKSDEDDWVRVTSQMLSNASNQPNQLEVVLEDEMYTKTRDELLTILKQRESLQFVPLEYIYLSSNAIPPLPNIYNSNSHFKLKKGIDLKTESSQINQMRSNISSLSSRTSSPIININSKLDSYGSSSSLSSSLPTTSAFSSSKVTQMSPLAQRKRPFERPSLSSSSPSIPVLKHDMMNSSITSPNIPSNNGNIGNIGSIGNIGNSNSSISEQDAANLSERKGLQKKNKMMVLDMQETLALHTKQVELKAAKKAVTPEDIAEKERKKKEKEEQTNQKKEERETKKRKKEEEKEAKKMAKEQKKIEKEASKKVKPEKKPGEEGEIQKPKKGDSLIFGDSLSEKKPKGDTLEVPRPVTPGVQIVPPSSLGVPLPSSTSLTPQALGLSGLPIQQSHAPQNFQVASENANLSSLLSQALGTNAPKPTIVTPGVNLSAPKTPNQAHALLHQQLVQKINQKPGTTIPLITPSTPTQTGQSSLPLPLAIQTKQTTPPKLPEKPTDSKPVQSNNPLINALNAQNPQIPDNLFEQSNSLSESDKLEIIQFLTGPRNNPPSDPPKQFLLHQEIKSNSQNSANVLEQLVFEINYQVGTWRKLRRKKNLLPSQVAEYTATGVPVIQIAPTPVILPQVQTSVVPTGEQ